VTSKAERDTEERLNDLLAEVDALRAAGDKLADAYERYAAERPEQPQLPVDVALAGWREARRG